MSEGFHGLEATVKHGRTILLGAVLGLSTVLAGQSLAQTASGPAPAGEAQTSPPKAAIPELSVFQLLLKGGWFMVPIGLCSIMGLTIIIERFMALRHRLVLPPRFMPGLKAVGGEGDAAIQYCRANDSPIARIISAGLHQLSAGPAAVEEAIEDAGANEVSKLRRNLRLLFGVAAVSPMLGLLGSVSGMIRSFQVASITGVGKAELLSKGIYEALVSTYGGLLVAIPTLIAYYFFLNRIDGIVTGMNDVCRDFLESYATAKAAE